MEKMRRCLECGMPIDESNSIDGYCEDCSVEIGDTNYWDHNENLKDGFNITERP